MQSRRPKLDVRKPCFFGFQISCASSPTASERTSFQACFVIKPRVSSWLRLCDCKYCHYCKHCMCKKHSMGTSILSWLHFHNYLDSRNCDRCCNNDFQMGWLISFKQRESSCSCSIKAYTYESQTSTCSSSDRQRIRALVRCRTRV